VDNQISGRVDLRPSISSRICGLIRLELDVCIYTQAHSGCSCWSAHVLWRFRSLGMVITVSASGGSTLTIRLATSASNLPQTQTFSSAQCFQAEYVCSKGLKDAKAASAERTASCKYSTNKRSKFSILVRQVTAGTLKLV